MNIHMRFTALFLTLSLAACNTPETNTPAAPADTTSSSAISSFKPENVHEKAVYSRAFNTVIWGMPAVNYDLFIDALRKAGGDYNRVVYWSGLATSKNQTLTPNPDVIYINPFYDTRTGPVVLEIPPAEGASSITGSVDDAWQTAIEDVGPAGVDRGKGGKYFITPPGYTGKPPTGYIPMPSSTYTGFAILRSNLTNGSKEDLDRAIAYGKRVKIYLYAQAANPPQTVYVDLLNVDFNTTIPYNIRFFDILTQRIQREPWLTRDKAMIDPLKTIGIEKGKAFNPDARTTVILMAAITDAHQWINQQYQAVFTPPFYAGTHWALPASPMTIKEISGNYPDSNEYPIDGRAVTYSMAYFSAKRLGTGQFYLMTIRDNTGQPLDGSRSYRLHLPANVPVKLYWSVTAYDGDTHALIPGKPYSSRASTSAGLQLNSDGSVDLYFGPDASAGKESNWVPTEAGKPFELLARFYGPEKAFFDKTWKMGDVEKIK